MKKTVVFQGLCSKKKLMKTENLKTIKIRVIFPSFMELSVSWGVYMLIIQANKNAPGNSVL